MNMHSVLRTDPPANDDVRFELKGPDADGLVWLIEHRAGGGGMLNLGDPEGLMDRLYAGLYPDEED